MISQVVVCETLLNTSTSARCPAAPCTVPGMTRMSLVHGGVETWVVVAAFEAEGLALDAEEVVGGTDAPAEAVEPDEAGVVLGVLDVLCAPDPEVALLHPVSAAPAMSTNAVSCALLRIIGLPLLGTQSTSFTSSCRRRGATRDGQPFDTFMNISGRPSRPDRFIWALRLSSSEHTYRGLFGVKWCVKIVSGLAADVSGERS